MKKNTKSTGIPLDQIRLERLKDPKRANFATKVALQEFEAFQTNLIEWNAGALCVLFHAWSSK